METDGGGWTVFQRRQDASIDFYRGWQDYKNGFGDPNGTFWLGLDEIHRLTKSGQNVLRVDLMDWTNDTAYVKYGSFSVEPEFGNYKLNLSSFSGKYDLININFIKYSLSTDETRDGMWLICLKVKLQEETFAPLSVSKTYCGNVKNVGRLKRAPYSQFLGDYTFCI
jgi:hypothetical protein